MKTPLLTLGFLLLLTATLVASQVFYGVNNRRNGECTLPRSGGQGRCQPLRDCPPVLADAKIGNEINVCGERIHPLVVCCPVFAANQLISFPSLPIPIKTVPPPTTVPECGIQTRKGTVTDAPRFLGTTRRFLRGGRDADFSPTLGSAWPWMALLGQRKDDKFNWYCAGTLLNNRWVLTAAHCLNFGNPDVIRLGEFNTSSDDEIDHIDFPISRTVLYPNYQPMVGSYHDLVLIELAKDVSFRVGISPICLPWGEAALRKLHNETVAITGWGATVFGGSQANVLQEASVTVFPSETCDDAYQRHPAYTQRWPQGIAEDTFLCAGKPEGGVDTCQGDSGGPLGHLDHSTGRFVLRGVVSQGFGCGLRAFPGLYVPVAEQRYLGWIKEVAFSNS